MVTACFDRSQNPRVVEEALGPVTCGVFGEFAVGDTDGLKAYDRAPLSMVFGFLGNVVKWRLSGAQRKSPFFDASTGALSREPKVLSEQELADVMRRQQFASDGS